MSFCIFWVDDEEEFSHKATQLLEQDLPAYSIHGFTDPYEALLQLPKIKPDLILLDLYMPSIHGLEFLQQVKKLKIATRVIVVSANDTIPAIVSLIKAGACDYIVKPFTPSELALTVKRTLVLEDTLDHLFDSSSREASSIFGQLSWEKEFINGPKARSFQNLLTELFNFEELKSLCFQINVDFDNLAGQEKEVKIRELIHYCYRHNLLKQLVDACANARPTNRALTQFHP